MVRLLIAGSAGRAEVAAEVRGRARLVDLCDELRAPVGFGCRAARCATCRVEVVEGAHLLDPPDVEEAELLAAAPGGVRLACQAAVREGEGTIRLRWIGPRSA